MGHGISCSGYTQPMVRTGYEQVLAQRTTSLFAYTAKQDGIVVSKTDTGVIIEYNDKSKKGIEIGRRFSSSAGLTYPQDIVCELSVGQSFKKGDVISYNSGFFESDYFNPKNVVWKSGLIVKTVLWESNQTHEDASSISKRLAGKLTSRTAKIKTIVVRFDQEVRSVVKVGQEVEPESVLCTIEDALTSNNNLFDEESLNTLKMLSNQTPTAKVRGVVDKIEVFYHGEKEDMSNTLLQLSNLSDREMLKRTKSFSDVSFNGSVNDDFRVDGEPLMPDTMAIRIYITSDVPAGSGD